MARDVNVECESEHVHSVVWYRVKGYGDAHSNLFTFSSAMYPILLSCSASCCRVSVCTLGAKNGFVHGSPPSFGLTGQGSPFHLSFSQSAIKGIQVLNFCCCVG
jgi:hypothetical protein